MMTIRAIIILTLAGTVAGAEPASWLNADCAYRARVGACSPDDRENALLEWDVDFSELLGHCRAQGAFDVNSPRVTWLQGAKETEVPFRFLADRDNPAKGRLCWLRMGVMPSATEETFLVYFDVGKSKQAKSYPQMAKVQPVLGKNLLENGAFNLADESDDSRPAGWSYRPNQPAGIVEWVEAAGHSINRSLKLTCTTEADEAKIVMVSQQAPVEAGKRYALSGWIKVVKEGEGAVCLTGWFSGPQGKAVAGPDGDYSNYKNQLSISGKSETPWRFVAGTRINVQNPKTQSSHPVEGDKVLPDTETASIQLEVAYGQATACFADIEFRELKSGPPMAIWAAAIERKP